MLQKLFRCGHLRCSGSPVGDVGVFLVSMRNRHRYVCVYVYMHVYLFIVYFYYLGILTAKFL